MQKLFLSLLLIILTTCTQVSDYYLTENPAGTLSHLPRLFTDDTGRVYMSWVEMKQDTAVLKYSTYYDDEWDEPHIIASSDNWFVNWADFPSIIARSGEPMAAHWLQKKPGGVYAYDVTVSLFNEKNTEQKSFVIHDDKSATEHGFVSMQPLTDSTFYAIWLDGKNTTGGHGSNDTTDPLSGAMTLRGALISETGEKLHETEIDNSVCDCCGTALTKTDNGLLAAYRNRTEDEVRDIHLAAYTDNRWIELGSIADDAWNIAACPVNGPAIDANDDNVAVAWFTGANDLPRVKMSVSVDSGSSFSRPIILDSGQPLGRVDLEIDANNDIWVSWMTRTEQESAIVVRKVSALGKMLSEYRISDIDPSRSTGFPQITNTDNGTIMVAWTEIQENFRSVKTATLQ